jgi:hypothetical protein
MKRTLTLVAIAFALAPAAHARTVHVAPLARPFMIRVTDQGGGFSVDLPIVGRVHGVSTTFFTALDITNNTAQPTGVDFFYTPADGSATRSGSFGTLNGLDNIHTEDFLQSLGDAGIISPTQVDNSFGTLLVTFTNPAFKSGTEATALARIWSFASGSGGPTYGLSYRAIALHTAGAHSLAALVRSGGGMVSNIGIENVGIDDGGNSVAAPVTVRLSFFDPATGAQVGGQPTFTLALGQVTQINDVLNGGGTNPFQLPAGATSLIVFVDEIAGASQIAGYSVLKDTTTNDGSFVFMQESRTPF